MTSYFITSSTLPASDREEAVRINLHHDHFAFTAFLFGPLYLLWIGLWTWGLALGLCDIIIIALGIFHLFTPLSIIVALILVHYMIGVEAHQQRLNQHLLTEDIIAITYGDDISAYKVYYNEIANHYAAPYSPNNLSKSAVDIDWLTSWKGQP
jgi:Protein of unknown function (DUF2628)